MKPHTFGALRLYLANMGYNKEAFRAFLTQTCEYDEATMKEIREAFLTIGKVNEVKPDKVFGLKVVYAGHNNAKG